MTGLVLSEIAGISGLLLDAAVLDDLRITFGLTLQDTCEGRTADRQRPHPR